MNEPNEDYDAIMANLFGILEDVGFSRDDFSAIESQYISDFVQDPDTLSVILRRIGKDGSITFTVNGMSPETAEDDFCYYFCKNDRVALTRENYKKQVTIGGVNGTPTQSLQSLLRGPFPSQIMNSPWPEGVKRETFQHYHKFFH